MKKLLLTKWMLLLCALVVGSGSVWADEETITLSDQGYSNQQKVSSTEGTVVTLTYVKGTAGTDPTYYNTGNGVRVYAGGHMTVAANGNTMTKVVVTYAKNNSPTISWSSNGTNTTTNTSTPATWEGSATSVDFNVASSGHARIQSVTVTYTPAAKIDPTITFNDGSVRVGKTLNLSTLFTSNSAGAVTYSITSGGSNATIDGNVLTGVAEGSVTVKATQAAAGTYNAGEATATITVQEALTLSSIAITTAPTKTTYTEGETFDATGMVVTATYSDSSTDDVTTLCSWTPSGALTTSDSEITVSYTENVTTKTATQSITVNEYVQPTTISATLNYEFLGVASGSRISEKTTISRDNVKFVFDCTGSNWHQGDATLVRSYKDTSIEIEAPNGYKIIEVTFNFDSNKRDFEVSSGNWSRDNAVATWTGSAHSVIFSNTEGRADLTSVSVKITNEATLTLAPACTDGSKYYGTYSNDMAFVVPADLTVAAVKVADGKLEVTPYATGDVVKANTGVMVSSATAGEHTVVLTAAAGTEIDGNMLKASGDAGIDAATMNKANTMFYRLTMHNGSEIGFWWGAADGAAFALAANKAYLAVPTGAGAREGFAFGDDETTGIRSIDNGKLTMDNVYDMQGRRVAQPQKGLYIVNGKKVVIK